MDKTTHIRQLLERYQLQSLSPQEYQELMGYLEGEHQDFEFFLEDEWKNAPENMVLFSAENEFSAIKGKLGADFEQNLEQITESVRQKKRFVKWVSYAAVLVSGLLLSWFLLQKYSSVRYSDKEMIVSVSLGSRSSLILPDGSRVILNAGSILKYPQNFGSKVRVVELQGEGYFDVAHDQYLPFLVKTKDILVRVFGTQFNLKAYSGDKITETILMKGSVGFYPASEDSRSMVDEEPLAMIKPGQRASVTHLDGSPAQIRIDNLSDPEIYTDWKDNVLVFSNESFSSVITKLERWYNVQVILKNKLLAPVKLSGRFNRESVEDVLKALQMLQSFHYSINKNIIEIY